MSWESSSGSSVLDSSILTELLAQALANLDDAQVAARVNVQAQAFQLAGRDVPVSLQTAGIRIQFAELGKQFRDLGLDASILTGLLRDALENLDGAREQAQASALQQAFSLTGKNVPIELQVKLIEQQFRELEKTLGLARFSLTDLFVQTIDNLLFDIDRAKRQAALSAQQRGFQLAGSRSSYRCSERPTAP